MLFISVRNACQFLANPIFPCIRVGRCRKAPASIEKGTVARNDDRWVNRMRENCRLDIDETWIETHMPMKDGRVFEHLSHRKSSAPATVTVPCRDDRLKVDPTLQVVQEYVTRDGNLATPMDASVEPSDVVPPSSVPDNFPTQFIHQSGYPTEIPGNLGRSQMWTSREPTSQHRTSLECMPSDQIRRTAVIWPTKGQRTLHDIRIGSITAVMLL